MISAHVFAGSFGARNSTLLRLNHGTCSVFAGCCALSGTRPKYGQKQNTNELRLMTKSAIQPIHQPTGSMSYECHE